MATHQKLTATIIKDIGIIKRFQTPHKYEIGKTGVTIDLNYQAWPSVITDENGVIYAFISGRLQHIDPFGQTLMYTSRDNGDTWSEPVIVNDTPMDDRDVGAVYLGDGKILITYFRISAWDLMSTEQSLVTKDGFTITGTRPAGRNPENGRYTNGYLTWQNDNFTTPEQKEAVFAYWRTMNKADLAGGVWCLTSQDYGKTWSEPLPAPCSSPHGAIQLRNGDLFYVGRGAYAGEGGGGDGIYAFTSKDFGRSWSFVSKIHENQDALDMFCEPHVVELQSGRLLVGIRVEGKSRTIDGVNYIWVGFEEGGNPIYGCNGKCYCWDRDAQIMEEYNGSGIWQINRAWYRVYTCWSDDNGKTWTKPQIACATDITGVEKSNGQLFGTPPHLLQMENGAVVMTYCSRDLPLGQRAIVSYDDGETWDKEIVLCNKPEDAEPGAKSKYLHGDIGYPATCVMADGNLLSVYYQAYTGDKFCSFLYTKWSLK